jgi:hypothetical protein
MNRWKNIFAMALISGINLKRFGHKKETSFANEISDGSCVAVS